MAERVPRQRRPVRGDCRRWIAAWEAQAAEDGLERGSAYWQAAWDLIAAERRKRSDQ